SGAMPVSATMPAIRSSIPRLIDRNCTHLPRSRGLNQEECWHFRLFWALMPQRSAELRNKFALCGAGLRDPWLGTACTKPAAFFPARLMPANTHIDSKKPAQTGRTGQNLNPASSRREFSGAQTAVFTADV